jgi:hypothetical protein
MKRGADVQYLAAMLLELREGRTTNVESSFCIDVENCAKTIWRQLFRRAEKVTGRAVHNDINLAEVFDRLCDCLFDCFGLAYIGNDCERFAAVCVDGVSSRLQMLDLATRERNTRTSFGKRARDSAGDPRSTAGHKRHAPIQNCIIKNRFTHILIRVYPVFINPSDPWLP